MTENLFSHTDERMRAVLENTRIIAVVGLSDKPERASFRVAHYLKQVGYQVVPVNPGKTRILDEPCFPSLAAIPFPVDLVTVFRRSEEVPETVEAVLAIGARALWLQIGVVHDAAARRALEHGLAVVMDRCVMVEHARLCGAHA